MAKRQREVDKKAKAEAKRIRRNRRKEDAAASGSLEISDAELDALDADSSASDTTN